VADSFLADAAVVPVSAVTGAGLDQLRAAIAEVAAGVPERAVGSVARLPIDRSFSMAGYGAVVTGTLGSGTLHVGEEVDILPAGQQARIRGLQWHGVPVETVSAGQRAAVNLSGIKHDELARGDVLCTRGAFSPTSMVDGRVVLDKTLPHAMGHGTSVSFHLGTSEVRARLVLLDRTSVEPGGEAWAQLRLASPVVARRGDRFILRTAGGEATLGGGSILDAHPLKHRRQRADAAEAIARLADGGLTAAIVHELHKAAAPLRLSTLALQLAEGRGEVGAALGARIAGNPPGVHLVQTGADAWVYDRELLGQAAESVLAALAAHHREKPLLATGLSVTALGARIDPARRLAEDVVAAMMEQLVAGGRVRRVENTYALATHRVELDEGQAALRKAILEACLAQPFAPPTLTDLQRTLPYPPAKTASMHEALLKSGDLVDGDVCGFHPEAVEDAWRRIEAHLKQHKQATMSELRQLLDTSRRYAMGLMHHFDEAGRLVREGDYRRLP